MFFESPTDFWSRSPMDEIANGLEMYLSLGVGGLRLAACGINLPRQPSCMTPVADFPLFVRIVLGIIGADDFMQLSTSRTVS